MNIDKNAVVDKKAELADNVTVGPLAVIEGDTAIDSGTTVDSHAIISSGTRIGKNCRIFPGAVIGKVPQDLKFENEYTTVHIGDNTTIREYVTINRATKDRLKTDVGSDCLIMAYVHIAHDCAIGNNVIIANAVNMAGHVSIDDWAIIGGMVPIHQFVRIGKHAFVGGGFRCDRDIPPYVLAAGQPMIYKGLNSVGLRRRSFSKELRNNIKNVYKTIYQSNLNVSQGLEELNLKESDIPELQEIYRFYSESERGVI